MTMQAGASGDAAGAVRIGLIGCGDIARRVHVPGLTAAGARVIRFASEDLADAEAAAAASGQPDAMATDDWRQLVASVHIDAVDVCTPNHLHAEMALAALENGKHVLVESPMALTAAEADALLKLAARQGLMVIPAMSVRFIGPYAAIAAAARSGAIGTVTSAEIAFGHDGPEALNPTATWYLDRARSGGGPLRELGTAQVDLLRAALGREVVEVSAVTLGHRGSVEERAEVRLSFDGGATAQLRCGWAGIENLVRIEGTEGALVLDGQGRPVITRPDGEIEPVEVAATPSIEAVFVDAVARGEVPSVNATDGRWATAVVDAAYASSTAARPIEVTPPSW